MPEPLRVGIIGASADGGWAREGHVPAVQGLAGFTFAAVAASSQKTADAAARAFGVPAAFGSGMDLIRSRDVDLVTVATPVTGHRELVLAALAAGKHVYCEWPLGRGLAETEELATAARSAGVHVAIGLQLRGNPIARKAQALIASGTIGRVLSMRIYSATAGFGPIVPQPYVYLEDPANFANLITIQGAHTVDLAIALAGGLADLSALATAQYPVIKAGADGDKRSRTTFDHLLLQSRFTRSGTLSIEVAGGRPPETPFSLDVVGEAGTLRLDGGAARGFQSGRLALSVDGAPLPVDEGELSPMPDAARSVAGIYAALRDDIAQNTFTVVNFDHASKLTQLVTDLFASSRDGSRVAATTWPEH